MLRQKIARYRPAVLWAVLLVLIVLAWLDDHGPARNFEGTMTFAFMCVFVAAITIALVRLVWSSR